VSEEQGATAPRGLPAPLPPGERLLWQGAPRWDVLARRAFHVGKLATYCGALLLWRLIADLSDGQSPAAAALAALWLTPLVLGVVGIPALLAWLFSRTTVYTITSRRLVLRSGVALPMTLNIPFRVIESAALKSYRDGTGDIPLALAGPDRISYLHLWPNARPWRVARPEPMLRAVPDAARVADILARALAAAAQPESAEPPLERVASAVRRPRELMGAAAA
jgi:Bacterial PH domain